MEPSGTDWTDTASCICSTRGAGRLAGGDFDQLIVPLSAESHDNPARWRGGAAHRAAIRAADKTDLAGVFLAMRICRQRADQVRRLSRDLWFGDGDRTPAAVYAAVPGVERAARHAASCARRRRTIGHGADNDTPSAWYRIGVATPIRAQRTSRRRPFALLPPAILAPMSSPPVRRQSMTTWPASTDGLGAVCLIAHGDHLFAARLQHLASGRRLRQPLPGKRPAQVRSFVAARIAGSSCPPTAATVRVCRATSADSRARSTGRNRAPATGLRRRVRADARRRASKSCHSVHCRVCVANASTTATARFPDRTTSRRIAAVDRNS